MDDEELSPSCPYCGEPLDLDLERDVEGSLIQDCAVCCNPIQLDVSWDDDGNLAVRIERTD